ncbi:MAG: hypothetical protein AAF871_15410 [Pseudomonadota bacterium]
MRKILIFVVGATFVASSAGAASLTETDANADGLITFDEVLAVMPDVTEESFRLADANEDGMIDAEEFAAAQETGLLPAS